MATCPVRTRERTVRVGREALSTYQGGEAATQAPVKRPIAGPNPAPGARAARTLPGAHAPAVRLERTPRYERGDRRFESSRGYGARRSRKHLVRLPGCLPGEAGSIPVGGATPAWVAQLGRGGALRPHPVRVRIPPQVRRASKQKGGDP